MTRFLARLGLLLAIVLLVQLGVVPHLHKSREVKQVFKVMEKGADIVYFCDSTNRWTSANDKDVRSIGDMTSEYFPQTRLGQLDRNGFHAGVYEKIVQLMIDRDELPQALIVPVNLRSFCSDWMPKDHFSELENELRFADRQWVLGALAVKSMFPVVAQAEDSLDSEPALGELEPDHAIDKFTDSESDLTPVQRSKRKFVSNYMYQLSPDHQRLRSLANLSRRAESGGSRVIFYITPIDIDAGSKILGTAFEEQVESNIQIIRDALAPVASRVVDLSFELPSETFTYEIYPDEHLNQEGRAYVATALQYTIDDIGVARADSSVEHPLRFVYQPSQRSRIALQRTEKHR